jgi:hypothetical protein
MRTHIQIDDKLLRDAKRACGDRARTTTDVIRIGLELIVSQDAARRLAALLGSEPAAAHVPRRREKRSA